MSEDPELTYLRSQVEALTKFAMRVEPVCRNCIHAGPLTYTGNAPYRNDWGSCQKGAPVAGPIDKLGSWDQHTSASVARWPSVHHSDTCGEFKLRSTALARPQEDHIKVSWGWSEGAEP